MIFIQPSQAASFTLTISSSGSSAENSGWTYSSGEIRLTSAVTISPSDIQSKLATGSLIINAARILVSSSITSTSANDLTLKSEENILIYSGVTIETQGGDVILNSNSDSLSKGSIRLGLPTDTADGSIITNGGNIVLGGGNDPLVNFAEATTNDFPAGKSAAGVALYGFRLNAGGGNISIRGSSALTSSTSQRSVFLEPNASTDGSTSVSIETNGSGSISIFGDGSQIGHGNAWGSTLSGANIKSGAGAINISGIGKVNNSNPRGVIFSNTNTIESTSGGNITIQDTTNGSLGIYTGLYNGGTVNFKTTGAVLIQADEVVNAGTWVFENSSATIKSYTSSSFTANPSLGTVTCTSCYEFSFGQEGNTANLTVSSLTVIGPINLFGAAIALAAQTATNSTISITASGAVTQSGALTATNLVLNGSGEFTLQNSLNNVSVISAGTNANKLGSLKYTDSAGGLAIGTIGSNTGIYSSGLVEVATSSGDLNISTPIVSELVTGDAVLLYANKAESLSVEGDGNIKLSGTGNVTIPAGSRALLYSGARNTSTGLVSLVGGNSNTRSPYDATTLIASMTPAVDSSGTYAIFRIAATEPASPTFNSVLGGNKQLTISFTAGSDGGATISDYEYSLNGGSYVSAGTTASPFTITGLSGRTSYSVTLKARNSIGLSTASSSLSATTSDASLDASEAAAAETARVAAANAEVARAAAAKQQKELTEILSIIPELGKLSLNIGKTSKALTGNKCVKGKTIKYVFKGEKCPKGFVKKK